MSSYVIEYTSASNPYPEEDPARLEVASHFGESTTQAVVDSIASTLRESFQVRVITATTTVSTSPWETDVTS